MNNVEDDTCLYGSDARVGGLQLPEASCFSKKAIMERTRIPILGAV